MVGAAGRCWTPIGNTVNVGNASYLNNIGHADLWAVWTDPDFNPKHRAFYCAPVPEIPSPRWQTCPSKFFGLTIPETVPMSGQ